MVMRPQYGVDPHHVGRQQLGAPVRRRVDEQPGRGAFDQERCAGAAVDRKSVVEGQSVSVRGDLGVRRIIKHTTSSTHMHTSLCSNSLSTVLHYSWLHFL